jgi:TrpR-related protein YerC/YecD
MNNFQLDKEPAGLFQAILSLKSSEEAEKFFRDLCTAKEMREMDERWKIAKLLEKGLPYREIAAKLKVSTTTVSRVASWKNGGTGGYRLILDRLAAHHNLAKSFRKS